jgi:hypothetical protein
MINKYKIWRFSLYIFLQSPVTPTLLGPYILVCYMLFSHTHNVQDHN